MTNTIANELIFAGFKAVDLRQYPSQQTRAA